MHILVLNCGSSTLKFQLLETDQARIAADADRLLARGIYERLGSQALVTLQAEGQAPVKLAVPLRDHKAAIDHAYRWLASDAGQAAPLPSLANISIQAVGHRVVHGGEKFNRSMVIDADVIKGIEDCIDLAPLHNPANLQGIRAVTELLGARVPQVAVFDTSFHAHMPESAFLYAIPYQFYRRYRIRRYGFHGSSHRYVAYRYRHLTGKSEAETRIVTLHLGNGCSACAISAGRSIDTSMGLTPLEGLVMGTRSGDLDPAILDYLALKEGLTLDQLDAMLTKQAGLLGVSGLTNDMRELLAEESESGDRRAKLAIDIFCMRVRKYIGAYLAELGGADAVIFAGGIGENAPEVRRRIAAGLDWLGLTLDDERNAATVGREGIISTPSSRLKAYVIPTNEELLIARDTFGLVAGGTAG